MSRGLSVVRYRYSVAQVLSKILRDDLHSSDDDELLHDVSESDVECSVGMGNDDRTEQNRTELYYHKQKYLWQAARIANMAIYAGCP